MVLLIILLALLASSDSDRPDLRVAQSAKEAQHIMHKDWSGGFVDSTNPVAVDKWAHEMCRDVDLKQAATALSTEPTVASVAKKLIGNISDDVAIQQAALQSCEAELRKANSGT
jgi:hypothetical protein